MQTLQEAPHRRTCDSERKPCRGCGGQKEPGKARVFCDACLARGVNGLCPSCRVNPPRDGRPGSTCTGCHREREHARRGKPCRRCGAAKVVSRANRRGKGLCEACKPFCPRCLVQPKSDANGGYCACCRQRANRALGLKRIYGIDIAAWERAYEAQSGCCAICRDAFPSLQTLDMQPQTRRLVATDHDHRTGVFRGLLCVPCNFAIGQLRDDPEVARAAAAYLEARQAAPPIAA